MKKYKNLFVAITLSLFFGASAVSCSDDNDGYSLGNYAIYMATINPDDNRSFMLDDSTTLYAAAPFGNYQTKYERAIINFTLLGENYNKHDYAIRLNGIYDVLTKNIIYIDRTNQHEMDSIGNEAIIVKRLWQGGGYINIEFEFQTHGDKLHMINLVNFNKDIAPTETEISLDFRHHLGGGKPNGYPLKGFVSFRLGEFKNFTSEKITFKINAKNYKGDTVIHSLEYKPQIKKNNSQGETLPDSNSIMSSEYY